MLEVVFILFMIHLYLEVSGDLFCIIFVYVYGAVTWYNTPVMCYATIVDDVAVLVKNTTNTQVLGKENNPLNAKIMLKTVEFARYKSFFSAVHLNN